MTEKALTLLGEKKFSQLKQLLSEMNPVDIAGILEEMPQESLPLVYRLLPKELAAEAFAEMDKDLQEILIRHSATRNCRKFWTNCILMMRWTSLRKCPPM